MSDKCKTICLTPTQEKNIPAWVEKWKGTIKNTNPADIKRATKGIKNVYKMLNTKCPPILVAQSPVEAVKMASKAVSGSTPLNFAHCFFGGSFYASWASFITYFRDEVGYTDENIKKFKPYEDIIASCNMVLWHENVAVIVDRPEVIKFDDGDPQMLHCEDGPAIRYRDGWTGYAWHGTQIPKEWIEDKENLDPSIALTWENIEQRRCAAEIIGWHNVLEKLNVTVIDEDGDPEIGKLVEVELPDIGVNRFLQVRCGTGRTFALPVPPDMESALEAQAWTWDVPLEEFQAPEIRT
jgi:hypothetical protein